METAGSVVSIPYLGQWAVIAVIGALILGGTAWSYLMAKCWKKGNK